MNYYQIICYMGEIMLLKALFCRIPNLNFVILITTYTGNH
jgi:hypothetical protein